MTSIVKSGYLRRYSRKFMSDGWKNVWVVLHSDSTLAWFKNQGDSVRKGQANMKAVSNYFAVGQYAKNVPGLPPLPAGAKLDHIIAIPEAPRRDARVEFLLASNDQELGDWMNAIATTVAVGNTQQTGGSGMPMPSLPVHQAPGAIAPAYGPAPAYPGSYAAQGYPELGFTQVGGYPPQSGSSINQPPYVPAQGYAPYPYHGPPMPPMQPAVQSRPYPVQSGVYGYPGQGYTPMAPPVAYAGVPAAPAHTVIVRDRGCSGSPGLALATGGTGLVGGLAAGYMMGAALGGGHHHHHHHHGHYGGGFGLGHHWGSWSSLSSAGSFGSFGSWSD